MKTGRRVFFWQSSFIHAIFFNIHDPGWVDILFRRKFVGFPVQMETMVNIGLTNKNISDCTIPIAEYFVGYLTYKHKKMITAVVWADM